MNRYDVDGALERVAPDAELDGTATQAWRGVYRGHDELKRFWREFTEPWESTRGEIEEFIRAPGDAVVTRQTAHFVGRDGIEVTTRTSSVYQFRDGLVVRLVVFNDLDDALAAAGLSE